MPPRFWGRPMRKSSSSAEGVAVARGAAAGEGEGARGAGASPRPAARARAGASGELSPQLTALFTSAPILASAAAVNSVSAKEVGHMAPSSRFASSLKPNVEYPHLTFRVPLGEQT